MRHVATAGWSLTEPATFPLKLASRLLGLIVGLLLVRYVLCVRQVQSMPWIRFAYVTVLTMIVLLMYVLGILSVPHGVRTLVCAYGLIVCVHELG